MKASKETKKTQEMRKIATLSVQSALRKKDYGKLADLVELADAHDVAPNLRSRAWNAVAEYWFKQGHNTEATIAYNAARVLNPTNQRIIMSLFRALDEFLSEYREKFSSTDLLPLKDQIQRILEFYKAKRMWDSPPIELGKRVSRRINYIIKETKPAKETPATHKTDKIIKVLRSNVSFEEVKADYARIIAPIFWEMMAKEIDEEKAAKKKKKRGKKKPTKESKRKEGNKS
jgi:hypothetical protein